MPPTSYKPWLLLFVLVSWHAVTSLAALFRSWLFDLFSYVNWLAMHLVEGVIVHDDSSHWNQWRPLRSYVVHRLSRIAGP